MEGLKFLASEACPAIVSRSHAVATCVYYGSESLTNGDICDSHLSSSAILDLHHNPPVLPDLVRSVFRGGIKLGLCVGGVYIAYKCLQARNNRPGVKPGLVYQRCQELANGMSELEVGDVELDMNEEGMPQSGGDSESPAAAVATPVLPVFGTHPGLTVPPPIEEVPWFGDESVPAVVVDTAPPAVVVTPAPTPAPRRRQNKHKRKPFLMEVINKTKNHFGGVPKPSESNIVSVTRYVKDVCDEHNLVPYQTRLVIAYCVPLIMTPDEIDIQSKAYLYGIESSQRRARSRDAGTLESWLSLLINNPLSGTSWRRAVNALFGKSDAVAFQLVR